MSFVFYKMHGLGNDFVVAEGSVDDALARRMADRRRGIGCDQVLVMEPPRTAGADVFMRIFNADGSVSAACGNGTRCVADLWMERNGRDRCVVETEAGLLPCARTEGGLVQADMGAPVSILPVRVEGRDAVAVDVGNPHCVFFVADAEAAPLETVGPRAERDPLFPRRANVEFAQVMGSGRIRVRVWERGAGVTQACGSGACAVLAAAVFSGLLSGRRAEIVLDGGSLFIEQRESDGHLLMTGPSVRVFEGQGFSG